MIGDTHANAGGLLVCPRQPNPRRLRTLSMRETVAVALAAAAVLLAPDAAAQEQELLEPERAFAFSASAEGDWAVVRFDIADGYYMYKERFAFASEAGEIPADRAEFPEAIPYKDEFFGQMDIFRGPIEIRMPSGSLSGDPAKLTVISQGCADLGVCYPPMTSEVTLALAGAGGAGPGEEGFAPGEPSYFDDEESFVENVFASGDRIFVVGMFFLFGALLSFTPCVLPMVPILAGILTKQSPGRGNKALLSGVFVLGLATTFTAMGVAAGLGGSMFAYALQQPAALILYATVLVVFAGFLFEVLPMSWLTRISGGGGGARGGVAGAFSMGLFSSLITSACVAPPLAGALLYISKTGDAALGGAALFAMALGMSSLVVAAGVSSGALIPRMGMHSVVVKDVLAYLMLAVAAWLISPLISIPSLMLLFGLIACAGGIHLALRLRQLSGGKLRLGGAIASLVPVAAGLAYLAGGATGGGDPINPLSHLREGGSPTKSLVAFRLLQRPDDLGGALAALDGRMAMVYFTADWCVSCTELERFTFSSNEVASALGGFDRVKIDMSEITPELEALMERYEIVGPPSILFLDENGSVLGKSVGYKPPSRFLKSIAKARGRRQERAQARSAEARQSPQISSARDS